jgi:hypothetical protein
MKGINYMSKKYNKAIWFNDIAKLNTYLQSCNGVVTALFYVNGHALACITGDSIIITTGGIFCSLKCSEHDGEEE